MANDYVNAWDALATAIGAAEGVSSGSIAEIDHLTFEQQIQVAQVAALLSISQELSALNPQNTRTRSKHGEWVDGWGRPVRGETPQ